MKNSTRLILFNRQLWTPANISGALALWLDAADFSTITLNGSNVSEWRDKSRNNHHVAQATAANQPIYSAVGSNLKPSVVFDGVNDFLFRSGKVIPDVGITLLVIQFNSLRNTQNVINTDLISTAPAFYIQANVGELLGYSSNYFSAGNYIVDTPEIIGFQQSVNLSQIYRNGNISGSSGNNSGNNNGVQFSGMISNFGNPAAITLTEVVSITGVSGASISTTDRQRLEGYLAHKWGLAANLPNNHPFKITAPRT